MTPCSLQAAADACPRRRQPRPRQPPFVSNFRLRYSPPPSQVSFKQFYNLQSTSEIGAACSLPYDPYPFSFSLKPCLRQSPTSMRSLISSRPASRQKSSRKSKRGFNLPTTELSPVNSIGTYPHKLLEQDSGFVRLQSTNSGRNRTIMEAYGSKESPELGSR